MIVVIEAGCAECHGPAEGPLVTAHQFETVEQAKEWAQTQGWLTARAFSGDVLPLEWQPHPQGGEHIVVGQGSVWITSLATRSRVFGEDPS